METVRYHALLCAAVAEGNFRFFFFLAVKCVSFEVVHAISHDH